MGNPQIVSARRFFAGRGTQDGRQPNDRRSTGYSAVHRVADLPISKTVRRSGRYAALRMLAEKQRHTRPQIRGLNMSLSVTVAAMVSTGCTPEQIAAVVDAYEAKALAEAEATLAVKKARNAERQKRWRAESNAARRNGALRDVTERDTVSLPPEKEIPPTPPKEKLTPIPSQTTGSARAFRLEPSWEPSEEDRQFARDRLPSSAVCHEELEKFREYWLAKGGAAARKVDWSLTWRSWVRKAAERSPKVVRGLFPPAQAPMTPRMRILTEMYREESGCDQSNSQGAEAPPAYAGNGAHARLVSAR